MADETNALFGEMLTLLDEQIAFLAAKKSFTEEEMAAYRSRHCRIMELADRLAELFPDA